MECVCDFGIALLAIVPGRLFLILPRTNHSTFSVLCPIFNRYVNNGTTHTVLTDTNGTATYTITNPDEGEYVFGAYFAGDEYNEEAFAEDITDYTVVGESTPTNPENPPGSINPIVWVIIAVGAIAVVAVVMVLLIRRR